MTHKVQERSVEYISGAILPKCFFRKEPTASPNERRSDADELFSTLAYTLADTR